MPLTGHPKTSSSAPHLEHATHDILDVVSLHISRNWLQQTAHGLEEQVLHLVAGAEILRRRSDEVDGPVEVGGRHGPDVIEEAAQDLGELQLPRRIVRVLLRKERERLDAQGLLVGRQSIR